MRLIVENCESFSEWLMLEYQHAASIWGNAIFTNVHDAKMRRALGKIAIAKLVRKPRDLAYAITRSEHFYEVVKPEKLLVLDPNAKEALSKKDFSSISHVLVGGILGYEVPKGRTKTITSKAKGAKIRNLGKTQLTIDSAALVAKLVYLGANLKDIEITKSVEIKHSKNESTVLPYGYVVINKKVIITPGLVEYLR